MAYDLWYWTGAPGRGEFVRVALEAAGADISLIDGVRVRAPRGWWLLRASNTEAALVARAEAADESALAALIGILDSQLAESGVRRA